VKFHATAIPGVVVVEPEPHMDERGSFARVFCAETFQAHGLLDAIAQSSVSHNPRAGTLRGMHLQRAPHSERKLVRCIRGAAWDAVADLREDSPTYRHWHGVELTEENGLAVHVPEGCAHGFQTLVDSTTMLYEISVPYVAEAADGVRWDDPALDIGWPPTPPGGPTLSPRDRALPTLAPSLRCPR
jgi:dTDP-4-dehydrorhamnose 3,5-epimerase